MPVLSNTSPSRKSFTMRLFALIGSLGLLAGCASEPKTPTQTVAITGVSVKPVFMALDAYFGLDDANVASRQGLRCDDGYRVTPTFYSSIGFGSGGYRGGAFGVGMRFDRRGYYDRYDRYDRYRGYDRYGYYDNCDRYAYAKVNQVNQQDALQAINPGLALQQSEQTIRDTVQTNLVSALEQHTFFAPIIAENASHAFQASVSHYGFKQVNQRRGGASLYAVTVVMNLSLDDRAGQSIWGDRIIGLSSPLPMQRYNDNPVLLQRAIDEALISIRAQLGESLAVFGQSR